MPIYVYSDESMKTLAEKKFISMGILLSEDHSINDKIDKRLEIIEKVSRKGRDKWHTCKNIYYKKRYIENIVY